MESCPLHSTLRLRGFHERVPDKPGSQIFSHQQNDSSVDADHVGIIPVLEGIEGIHEPVLGSRLRVTVSYRLQNMHGGVGQECQ